MGPFVLAGDAELVADELRASGGDGVVVGDDAVIPDLMQDIDRAFCIDQAIGEGMSAGIEIAVRFETTGVREKVPR